MKKKVSILVFAVLLPIILGFAYDKAYRYSGNWLEDYQNYFKLGFLVVSTLGSISLVYFSVKEKSKIWLTFSILLLISLLLYLFFAIAVINTKF